MTINIYNPPESPRLKTHRMKMYAIIRVYKSKEVLKDAE